MTEAQKTEVFNLFVEAKSAHRSAQVSNTDACVMALRIIVAILPALMASLEESLKHER